MKANPAAETAAAFRARRLRYAAATSLGSKLVTLAVQLIALPVALRALGQEQFALYAMLAAAMGWLTVANLGIGPGLVVSIASAAARQDRAQEVRLLTSATLPVAGLAVMLALGALIASRVVSPVALFGGQYAAYSQTIRYGIMLLVFLMLAKASFSVIEAAQTGYQEQHVVNTRGMIGNAFGLVSVLVVAKYCPTVLAMILAVNAPLIMAQAANVLLFFRSRQYLLPRLSQFDWGTCRYLIGAGVAFTVAMTFGGFVNHQYTTVLVGRMLDAEKTAAFVATISGVILAFGMISMLAIPLWSAISDSVTRGDADWVKKAYFRLLLLSMLYSFVIGLLMALMGRDILHLWFGSTINPDQILLVSTGLYFILYMWEYVHYMVLIGLKNITLPSILYLGRSLLIIVLAPLLLNRFGSAGVVMSLCISLLLVTAWSLPLLTRRALANIAHNRTVSTPSG